MTSRALVVRVPLPVTVRPLPLMMSELTVSPAAGDDVAGVVSLTLLGAGGAERGGRVAGCRRRGCWRGAGDGGEVGAAATVA